jgi:ubiquitin C-terminal hydrolase
MRTAAQRGMRNPGTLCYQISLLQALFHQPKLVNFLAESHTAEDCVCDPEKSCLACALRIMSRGYWETPIDNPFYPKLFANSNRLFKSCKCLLTRLSNSRTDQIEVGWASDIRNGHADPDEQIAWIFCEMRKVLATSYASPLSLSLPHQANTSSPYSSLESITQMITTSSIRCHCGHESRTAGHPDRTLPISINPRIPGGTLAQYVKRYMVEAIEGYRCGACSESKRTKHRRNIVEHAPEILTLQLKRFNYDGRKITTDIPIGTSLDLGPYRDNGNEESMKYELSAVIKHAGSLTMGHYICSAKGPDGAWYSFDDSVVSKDSLRTATGLGGGFTPYLLFFQRQEA